MPPSKRDVEEMVVALFTLAGGLERARRRSPGAAALSLLQVIAGHGQIRPSEIAEALHVHPSLVTRQVRNLEADGYVEVMADPGDHRSCLIRPTPAGADQMTRLQQAGLERFAKFVAEWDPAEVRTFTSLLRKLEASKAAVAAAERQPPGRRWAQPRQ
ncbi:MAG: MarR family transcriptional regulator [Streptosporangiaceae bacterium]|jgi:DNA-binding MarR family transcriptional regulator